MITIPNYWEYQSPISVSKPVSRWKPIFGPEQTRGYGDGSPQRRWEIGAVDSSKDEYDDMFDIWNTHYPGVSFIMYDPQVEESRVYRFVSEWSGHYNIGEGYSWKVIIEEQYPFVTV